MATTSPAKRVWTYADLEDLPDDDQLYEILGGKLIVRNAPDANHAIVLIELLMFLGRAREAGFGQVYTTVAAVALDYAARGNQALYVPHPDLFYMRQDRAEELRGHRGWQGVPDLIVEILSPSTQSEHRPGGRWWDAYEQHGFPHYWLVDPSQRTIRQYVLEGEPYVGGRYGEPLTLRPSDTLTSSLFPSISVPVDRVFRDVR